MALSTLWPYLFSDSSTNGQRFLLIGIADSSGFSTSGQTARWEEDLYDAGGHWTGGGAQNWSFSKLKNPPAYIKTSLGPSECGCLFDSKYYTDTVEIPYAGSYGRHEYYITLGGASGSTSANYPMNRPIWSFSIPNNKMTAGTASSFSITNSKWYSLLRFEFIATYNGTTYILGSSNNYQITSLPITFDVEDAALAIPNATSFVPTVSMRVYRRNDDNTEDLGLLYTQGGVKPTVSLPESVRPTVTTVTPSDIKGYRTKFGVYVQGKSILAATTVASGIYNSTITKVDYVIDNKTGSTTDLSLVKTIGLLEQSGSRTLTTTVTDSRGRTGVKNLAITVAPYVNPSLTFQANRWNTETAQESDGSTTVRLVCSGEVPSINNVLVTGTLTVQGRQKGVEAWTTIGTASVSGTFEEIFTKTNQSLDYSYEYQAILTDEFGTTITQLSEVGTATPVLEFHSSGKGMGIGTIAPETGLSLGMELDVVGSEDDGYSRIKISDRDHINSTILANLGGDTLRILDQLLGIDRAFVGSHLFLDNNIALGGVTTSGGQTPILRMNTSNQVELTWTSGGLKGRVTKEIWSGTLSKGGSVTIPELPYYNLIAAKLNTSDELVYSYRPKMVNSTGTWYLGHAEISGNVQGGFWVMGATLRHTAPTKLTLKWAAAYNNTTFYSEYNIIAIYGIL